MEKNWERRQVNRDNIGGSCMNENVSLADLREPYEILMRLRNIRDEYELSFTPRATMGRGGHIYGK